MSLYGNAEDVVLKSYQIYMHLQLNMSDLIDVAAVSYITKFEEYILVGKATNPNFKTNNITVKETDILQSLTDDLLSSTAYACVLNDAHQIRNIQPFSVPDLEIRDAIAKYLLDKHFPNIINRAKAIYPGLIP